MKKIRAEVSLFALLFWIIVCAVFCAAVYLMNWPKWFVGLAPIYFIINILMLKFSSYSIKEQNLEINQYFAKSLVDFSSISDFRIKESGFIKRLFTGFPRKTIQITYNSFDSIEILTTDKNLIAALSN